MRKLWILSVAIVLIGFFGLIQAYTNPIGTHEAGTSTNLAIEVDSSGVTTSVSSSLLDSVAPENQWATITHDTKIVTEQNTIIEDRGNGRTVRFDLPPGYKLPSAALTGPRPPGSLLLNMLTKNEREHLDRVLPQWAKIVDCWVIGVDRDNTDDSVVVIERHLGHLPGRVVVVDFDGMGPTWTELVKVGYTEFPQCTHGIIADADFAPRYPRLDKRQLDVRCSKHMFTIWTQDLSNARRMDWIYRNVPGAHVSRRTHQIVEAPTLPHQEVYQTLIDLEVVEREGGYQDRTPGKMERYIGFLEADLEEHPADPRSLYYVGYAYFDLFSQLTRAWEALPAGERGPGTPRSVPQWRALAPAPTTAEDAPLPAAPTLAPPAPGSALRVGRNKGDAAREYATELNGLSVRVRPIMGNHAAVIKFLSLPTLPDAHDFVRKLGLRDDSGDGVVPLPAELAGASRGTVLNWFRWAYLELAVRFMQLRAHSHLLTYRPPAAPTPSAPRVAGVHTAVDSAREKQAGRGNAEERWFAMLKLGEIYERFYHDWDAAEHWYNECVRDDPDRADAPFYIGQHYRLAGDSARAAAVLLPVARMSPPQRSLFQWHLLYSCIGKLELARSVASLPAHARDEPQAHVPAGEFRVGRDSGRKGLTRALVADVLQLLRSADCRADLRDNEQRTLLLQQLQSKLDTIAAAPAAATSSAPAPVATPAASGTGRALHAGRVEPLRQLVQILRTHDMALVSSLSAAVPADDKLAAILPRDNQGRPVSTLYTVLQTHVDRVRDYLAQYTQVLSGQSVAEAVETPAVRSFLSVCRKFRLATMPLVRFSKQHRDLMARAVPRDVYSQLSRTIDVIAQTCR